jgi:hypothetical protein
MNHENLTSQQVAAWEKALDLFVTCLRRSRFEPGLTARRSVGA